MPEFAVESTGSRAVVTLGGDLMAALVPALQPAVKEVVDKGASELVFDLGASLMLDSTGMGLLIAAANSLGRSGGRVAVVNASPDILRLLRSMRLAGRLNASGREGDRDG